MEYSRNISIINESLPCSFVHQIGESYQCNWVKNTADCFANGGARINYATFIFCAMSNISGGKVIGLLIMFIWLIALFVILATVADKFFCPALTVVAKLCRLSESVAGVTILAFGNGSPDIFTSLAGLNSGHSSLIFSQLIGGALFVTSVVVGLVCILHPFEMNGMHFLRDCTCLTIASCWAFYVFRTGKIGIFETVGFVVLYTMYVAIVVFTRTFKRRSKQKEIKEMPKKIRVQTKTSVDGKVNSDDTSAPAPDELTNLSVQNRHKNVVIEESLCIIKTSDGSEGQGMLSVADQTQSVDLSSNSIENIRKHLESPLWSNLDRELVEGESTMSLDLRAEMLCLLVPPPFRLISTPSNTMLDLAMQAEHVMKLSMMNEMDQIALELNKRKTKETFYAFKRPAGLFQSFFLEMNPLILHSWERQSWYKKLLTVFQIPITLLLKLIIPVVNLTSINHGWCKLLNTLHCFTLPLSILFGLEVASERVWMIVIFSGCCLGLAVFLTSKADIVPRYHELFSLLGFVGAVWIIYLVANEIVGILRTAGVVLNISEAILGLTILAWGSSLGDMISNLTIAKAGFQKMGFAACFGGPLFGILLGIGLSSTYGLLKENQSIKVNTGDLGVTSMLFLLISLLSSLIILPSLKFRACRSYGFYLVGLYSIFIVSAILAELNIIPKLQI